MEQYSPSQLTLTVTPITRLANHKAVAMPATIATSAVAARTDKARRSCNSRAAFPRGTIMAPKTMMNPPTIFRPSMPRAKLWENSRFVTAEGSAPVRRATSSQIARPVPAVWTPGRSRKLSTIWLEDAQRPRIA